MHPRANSSTTDIITHLSQINFLPHIPDMFIDTISKEMMTLPVTASDGKNYDFSIFLNLFEQFNATSPDTREPLIRSCTINFDLYQEIRHFVTHLSEKAKDILIKNNIITLEKIDNLTQKLYQSDLEWIELITRSEKQNIVVYGINRIPLENPNKIKPNHPHIQSISASQLSMASPMLPIHEPEMRIFRRIEPFRETTPISFKTCAAWHFGMLCGTILSEAIPHMLINTPNPVPVVELIISRAWPAGALLTATLGTFTGSITHCILCDGVFNECYNREDASTSSSCFAVGMAGIGTFANSMTSSYVATLLPAAPCYIPPLLSYLTLFTTTHVISNVISAVQSCLFYRNQRPASILIPRQEEALREPLGLHDFNSN